MKRPLDLLVKIWFNIGQQKGEGPMPTTLSVYDAKAQFSRVLENVEENRVTVDRKSVV